MATVGVCQKVAICLTLTVAMWFLLQSESVHAERSNRDEVIVEDEFDNIYGLPGVQVGYEFELDAGRGQCFFQELRKDAQLHFSFQVRTKDLAV